MAWKNDTAANRIIELRHLSIESRPNNPYIYLSNRCTNLKINPSSLPPIHPSIHPTVQPSIHPSIHPLSHPPHTERVLLPSSKPSLKDPERLMVRVFSSNDMQEFLSRLSAQGSKETSWLVRLLLRSPARLIWAAEVGLEAGSRRTEEQQVQPTIGIRSVDMKRPYQGGDLPSCPKLKRVPEGDVRLDPGENGELLTESCSPLVECERSQSRASSWLRSWADGVYLRRDRGQRSRG